MSRLIVWAVFLLIVFCALACPVFGKPVDQAGTLPKFRQMGPSTNLDMVHLGGAR